MTESNHRLESIEVRLYEINMERIQYKGEKIASQKQDNKNITINEEEVQHTQMALLLMIWRKVSVKKKMTIMKAFMRK